MIKLVPITLLCLLFSTSLQGQEDAVGRSSPLKGTLTVKSSEYLKLDGVADVTRIGDNIYFQEVASIKYVPVGVIRVDTDLPTVEVVAFDQTMTPAKIDRVTENVYVLTEAGTYRVDVTAIGFDKAKQAIIYKRENVLVKVGQGPNPPPNPDPPGPNPPTPDEIPNVYGVGKIAYLSVPSQSDPLPIADVFKRAGEYLYGRPTLKTIGGPNDKDVLYWIDQQLSSEWNPWGIKIRDALRDSQRARPIKSYTREDWYYAFNEISEALTLRARK